MSSLLLTQICWVSSIFVLARFWAKYPSPFSTRYAPISSNILRANVVSVWNEEWPTDLSVKAFFPDVFSAKIVLKKNRAHLTQLQATVPSMLTNTVLVLFHHNRSQLLNEKNKKKNYLKLKHFLCIILLVDQCLFLRFLTTGFEVENH